MAIKNKRNRKRTTPLYLKILVIILAVSIGLNIGLGTVTYLSYKGYEIRHSTGISMCPTLGKDSFNIVKRVLPSEGLEDGEVYSFYWNSSMNIQHRLVDRRGGFLMFKGDNNFREEMVKREQIRNVLVLDIPISKCEESDLTWIENNQ